MTGIKPPKGGWRREFKIGEMLQRSKSHQAICCAASIFVDCKGTQERLPVRIALGFTQARCQTGFSLVVHEGMRKHELKLAAEKEKPAHGGLQ
jgi:hypothetical protein